MAEQAGQLGAAGEHPRQHVEVGRVGPLPLEAPEPLPEVGALGPGDHRHVVGGIGGDAHLAVVAGRARAQPVGGEAGQLGGLDPQLLHVVADVPAELLADADQLLAQLPHAGPRRVVPIDAGPPEVAEPLLDHPARDRVGAGQVDPGERLVQPAIQGELGLEGVELLLVALRGLARLGGGVDVAHQAGLGGGVAEQREGVVVEAERLVAREGAARLEPLHPLLGEPDGLSGRHRRGFPGH